MEDTILKGKWNELKGEIQDTWGKLKGDNLDRTKGNISAIVGMIQQEYGHAKEDVMDQLHAISERLANPRNPQNPVGQYAAEKTESVKQSMKPQARR
jgi:uncharacterized protein YjbJ (UPF0337 family)